jgi:hypothetical protein
MGMESVRMFHSTLKNTFLPSSLACILSSPGYPLFFFLRYRLKAVIYHSSTVRSIFDPTCPSPVPGSAT